MAVGRLVPLDVDLEDHQGVAEQPGFVIWLTGLPSSGKTTLSSALSAALLPQRPTAVRVLDGDRLRRALSSDLGFSAEDRQEHAKRVIALSKRLIREGVVVIVALISPYRATRHFARTELKSLLEVYVKCPIEVCISRDVKGLYQKALNGEISDLTGVTAPYEEPESPEVVVETDSLSVQECVQRILAAAHQRNYLGPIDGGSAVR